MLNFLFTLIFRPKTAEDALMLGKDYYNWWCEQRGIVELPVNPDKYANPFLTKEQVKRLKENE
jgi:hypothetical protein